eukprot:3599635-Prymnesium_polylepis.1
MYGSLNGGSKLYFDYVRGRARNLGGQWSSRGHVRTCTWLRRLGQVYVYSCRRPNRLYDQFTVRVPYRTASAFTSRAYSVHAVNYDSQDHVGKDLSLIHISEPTRRS